MKRLCPKCKKHTDHKVAQSKKRTRGTAHPLSRGSKKRIKVRGSLGAGNNGKYSKPPIAKWKRTGKKTSKKTDLRYTCSECKKSSAQKSGQSHFRRTALLTLWLFPARNLTK